MRRIRSQHPIQSPRRGLNLFCGKWTSACATFLLIALLLISECSVDALVPQSALRKRILKTLDHKALAPATGCKALHLNDQPCFMKGASILMGMGSPPAVYAADAAACQAACQERAKCAYFTFVRPLTAPVAAGGRCIFMPEVGFDNAMSVTVTNVTGDPALKHLAEAYEYTTGPKECGQVCSDAAISEIAPGCGPSTPSVCGHLTKMYGSRIVWDDKCATSDDSSCNVLGFKCCKACETCCDDTVSMAVLSGGTQISKNTKFSGIRSQAHCKTLCVGTEGCTHYTYFRADALADIVGGGCQLWNFPEGQKVTLNWAPSGMIAFSASLDCTKDSGMVLPDNPAGDCFETDVDYVGFDLNQYYGVRNANECQLRCQKEMGCKGFTFRGFDYYCFLKYDIGEKSKTSDATQRLASGSYHCDSPPNPDLSTKCIQKATAYGGNDVDVKENVPFAVMCQLYCQWLTMDEVTQTPAVCEFWTYDSGTQKCYLKANKGDTWVSQTQVSGPRYCDPYRSLQQVISDVDEKVKDATARAIGGIGEKRSLGTDAPAIAFARRRALKERNALLAEQGCFMHGTGCVGHLVNNGETTATGPLECQGKCLDRPDCNFFSFEKETQSCTLHYKGVVSPKLGSVVGPKACRRTLQAEKACKASKVNSTEECKVVDERDFLEGEDEPSDVGISIASLGSLNSWKAPSSSMPVKFDSPSRWDSIVMEVQTNEEDGCSLVEGSVSKLSACPQDISSSVFPINVEVQLFVVAAQTNFSGWDVYQYTKQSREFAPCMREFALLKFEGTNVANATELTRTLTKEVKSGSVYDRSWPVNFVGPMNFVDGAVHLWTRVTSAASSSSSSGMDALQMRACIVGSGESRVCSPYAVVLVHRGDVNNVQPHLLELKNVPEDNDEEPSSTNESMSSDGSGEEDAVVPDDNGESDKGELGQARSIEAQSVDEKVDDALQNKTHFAIASDTVVKVVEDAKATHQLDTQQQKVSADTKMTEGGKSDIAVQSEGDPKAVVVKTRESANLDKIVAEGIAAVEKAGFNVKDLIEKGAAAISDHKIDVNDLIAKGVAAAEKEGLRMQDVIDRAVPEAENDNLNFKDVPVEVEERNIGTRDAMEKKGIDLKDLIAKGVAVAEKEGINVKDVIEKAVAAAKKDDVKLADLIVEGIAAAQGVNVKEVVDKGMAVAEKVAKGTVAEEAAEESSVPTPAQSTAAGE